MNISQEKSSLLLVKYPFSMVNPSLTFLGFTTLLMIVQSQLAPNCSTVAPTSSALLQFHVIKATLW